MTVERKNHLIRTDQVTETEYISQVLSRLRNFARIKNVACFIVAHPTKLQKDPKNGQYPVPTPYDIAGSAHFRNKSDVCLCIWRDQKQNDGTVELHIQKVRNKNAGRAPNTIKLLWTRESGRITNNSRFS